MIALPLCAPHGCAFSDALNSLPEGLRALPGAGFVAKQYKKEGAVAIIKEDDLTVVHELRDSKRWIQSIKFSPNGAILAVASSDRDIYLYNANDFTAKGKCRWVWCCAPRSRNKLFSR